MTTKSAHIFYLNATDRTKKAVKSAQKNFNGLEKSLNTLKKATIGTAIFAGVMAAGRAAVNTSKNFETLKTSLDSVFGGTDRAAFMFGQINDFAVKTPFLLEDVTRATIRLQSVGLDPSVEALTSLGNTASAMSKPLMQVTEALADATTGQFERLKDFGINTQVEGDKVKFTFKNITTEVRKNASEIEKYLLSIGNTQFAGAIEKQSKTLVGVFSNLSGAVSNLTVLLMDKTGLNTAIKTIVGGFTSAINAISDWTKTIDDLSIAELKDRLAGANNELNRLRDQLSGADNARARQSLLQQIRSTSSEISSMEKQLTKLRKVQSDIEGEKGPGGDAGPSPQQLAEAKTLYESVLTPLEKYSAELSKINKLELAGAFKGFGGSDTADRLSIKAFGDLQKTLETPKTAMQEFIDSSKNQAETFDTMWANAFTNISDGAGEAFAQAVVYGDNLSDGLRAGLRNVTTQILSTLGAVAAKKLTVMALEKMGISTTLAASTAAAGTTAAAWAPAAGAVSLATGGANAVTAGSTIPMFLATLAGSFAAMKGQMHDGGLVPRTGTYFLEGGESVASKEHTRKMSRMLDSQTVGGAVSVTINLNTLDARTGTQFLLQNEQALEGMVQRIFNSNGKPGPRG